MNFWSLFWLLASISCLVAGFQPVDFHYWYLQSSIVVDQWLYIVAGDIVEDDATIRFMPYTYSIDTSQSWTTSDVAPLAISISDLVTHVKNPMLWFDPTENAVHMWGGLPFNASEAPGSYSFSPSDGGGVIWGDVALPSSSGGSLDGLWGTAYAYSPTEFYAIGGVNTLDGIITPVKSSITNDFGTNTWTNQTSIDGFNSQLSFDAKIEYVPNFGDDGVLIALGGRFFQNQSSYTDGDLTLADFSLVDIFDIGSKEWYSQHTKGDIPPVAYDSCIVGLPSDDKGSYEIFMFGGATNDTYDTANWNDAMYRDIYILSLPAFAWVRAQKPSEIRRRALSCQVIGKRQMLLIGGSFFANDDKTRVDPWPNGMAVFDLSDLEWTDGRYNSSAEQYRRASVVQDVYQQSAPVWDNPALAEIFPFRQSLTTPTNSSNSTATQPTSVPSPTSAAKKSNSNHTGAIAGGVVGGIAAIVLIVGCVYVLRRRSNHAREKQHPSVVHAHPQQEPSEVVAHPEMYGNNTAPAEMNGEPKQYLDEKEAMSPRRDLCEIATPATRIELQGDTTWAK